MDTVWSQRKKTAARMRFVGGSAVTGHSQESSLPGQKHEAIATCKFSNLLVTWSGKFPDPNAIPGWLSIFSLSPGSLLLVFIWPLP